MNVCRQKQLSARTGIWLTGMLTLTHTLKAKQRHLEEERRRERARPVDLLVPSPLRRLLPRRAASLVPDNPRLP